VIGDRVAALVQDGATLQLGIGAVPDAVLAELTGRRGLRVWSEMFSDGVLALDKAGRPGPGAAGRRVFRVRQRRALRLDGP
jgi:acyl-CoA hydrolase